jgi:hypothetical protein
LVLSRWDLGANWARRKSEQAASDVFKGKGGQHLLAALDLTNDKLYGWTIPGKKWWRFLSFLKYLRRKYSGKIYIILDNHSTHEKKEIGNWSEANNIEFAYTPTNASWLNPIECHFVPIKELVLRNVYYRDKKEQARAIPCAEEHQNNILGRFYA